MGGHLQAQISVHLRGLEYSPNIQNCQVSAVEEFPGLYCYHNNFLPPKLLCTIKQFRCSIMHYTIATSVDF